MKCENCGYLDVNANKKAPEKNCPSCSENYTESRKIKESTIENRKVNGSENRQTDNKEDNK